MSFHRGRNANRDNLLHDHYSPTNSGRQMAGKRNLVRRVCIRIRTKARELHWFLPIRIAEKNVNCATPVWLLRALNDHGIPNLCTTIADNCLSDIYDE